MITEGIIKVPEGDYNDAVNMAMLSFFTLLYCAYEYEEEADNPTRFRVSLLKAASKYHITNDHLKSMSQHVLSKDFKARNFTGLNFQKSFKMAPRAIYFVKIILFSGGCYYSPSDKAVFIDILTCMGETVGPKRMKNKDFLFSDLYLTDILKICATIEYVVRHEMMHAVQFLVYGKKDQDQIATHDDYADSVASDGDNYAYYNSNVEFYPQIDTSAERLYKEIPLSILSEWYTGSPEEKKQFKNVMEFYTVNRSNQPTLTVNHGIAGDYTIKPSPFFMAIKKKYVIDRQRNPETANNEKFTYPKALREFYKLVTNRIQHIVNQNKSKN